MLEFTRRAACPGGDGVAIPGVRVPSPQFSAVAPGVPQKANAFRAVGERIGFLNPTCDIHGSHQGCHGVGCQVDNPDKPGNLDDASSEEGSSRDWSNSSSTSINLGGRRGRFRGSWSVDSVVGDWIIGKTSGSSTCTLKLYADESFG